MVRSRELLAAADAPALLRCAQSLEQWAPDYAQVLDELAALLVRVAHSSRRVPDYEGDELYAPELLERLARALIAPRMCSCTTRPRSSAAATCRWLPTRAAASR